MLLLLSSPTSDGNLVDLSLVLDDATAGVSVEVVDQVERRAPVRSYLWLYDVEGIQAGVIA